MNRRLTLGLLLSALALGCGGGGSASARPASEEGRAPGATVPVPLLDGPVAASDIVDAYGQAIDAGDEMSLGVIRLFVASGHEEATVDRVRLVGVGGDLELLGIRTRKMPQPKGNFYADFGYPPDHYADTKPLAEQNVVPVPSQRDADEEPAEGLMLVIGLRSQEDGIVGARAVEVTYHVGPAQFTERYEKSIFLCSPMADFLDSGCPPENEDDRGWGDKSLG